MMKTKIQQPTKFDWSSLPLELFRGPGLSFPVKMEILIAPSFNTTVMSAMTAFVDDFTGHPILDRDSDSFKPIIVGSVTSPEGQVSELHQNSFGLRMTYMDENEKVVLLDLSQQKPIQH